MDKAAKKISFRADTVMVDYEASTPDLEPLYANHFEIMQFNSDVFLDIGIIKPLDLIALLTSPEADRSTENPPVIKFYVLERVAMSVDTLQRLRDKLTEITEQINKGLPSGSQAIQKI